MTPTDPNSDYDTQSTDLFQLLPNPLQSDVNRSVMSNLFNRFLSKTETTHTVGYVGQGNLAAVVSRQIKEPTVHRQAYQLQPILYDKIGSIEYMDSWYDILNGLTAQGVDINRQGVTAAEQAASVVDPYSGWAAALEFNWAPPIDINKIVNYRDYYWYDPNNPQSQPQYITVKSECSAALALVSFYSSLIAQNGATFSIVGLIPAMKSVVIQGNFLTLFAPGFVFYVENTANVDLNNSFQQVVSSTYNSTLNQTTIVINNAFTDSTLGGDISLEQQLSIYQGISTCKCTGSAGWDTLPWDDNQTNTPPPLWNAAVIADIAWPTLTAWNTAHPSPQQYDIWWDTTTDILYSLEDASTPTAIVSWKPVYYNFSLIEQQTTGAGYWDLSTGCADDAIITGLDQWISQNRWVHKADVPNFSIAKQAQSPIIEYEPNLELSEWTTTSYIWQYRANTQLAFVPTTAQPSRLELEALNIYTYTTNTITFDERYGDLTNTFVPGFNFLIAGLIEQWTVVDSVFERSSLPLGAFKTTVTVAQVLPTLSPGANYVYPEVTSQGDPFSKYGDQWLFVGINTTQAINHQPEQTMMTPTLAGPSYPTYTTTLAPYAEQFDIILGGVTTLNFDTYVPPGSTRSLIHRALIGTNDIRVYVNGIRQYGTYDELGATYVTGIQFLEPLQALDTVLVQIGEATYGDFGNYAVPVRTVANDTEFAALEAIDAGFQLVSLIQYRLNEQVKIAINQYPLFDIYNIDSTSANVANPIFGYYEAPNGVLYTYIGQRIVQAPDSSMMFQNYLVQSNNGPLYAYRNYNKSANLYWYNTNTQQVLIWTGNTWSSKYETSGGIWLAPVVQATYPTSPVTGLLFFNTTNNILYQWTGSTWITLPVYIATSDETLETNWRHGTNNEQFIANQVDWQQRSYPEYETQLNTYVNTTVAELIAADPSLTTAEATAEANTMWTQLQDRLIVPEWYTDNTTPQAVREGPLWIGNWQIPDPLYYNVDHEDWQYISATDLLTHFTTMVGAQPSYPGFGGQASANWRLIDYTQINWGLGGTIKEYDNSFDTFLSSQFNNTVTPPSLFSFAQSEYENIIVILRDSLTRNFVNYMTNTSTSVILDPGAYAATQVLTSYEENEAANLVYGDSTTYTQATSTTPASGVQNWIATLPFFGIVPKVAPYQYDDTDLGITGIMHHDGHRATYTIPQTIITAIQQQIVATPDPRITGEKIGRVSTLQPPPTQAAFISQFSSVLRNGVYWLQGPILYRLAVASVGTTPPTIAVPDGSLWWDTTTGAPTLRQQVTIADVVTWPPAPGFVVGDGKLYNSTTVQTSTISAWQVIDLNQIYLQVLLNAETLLYQQAPTPPITPPIDFVGLQTANPTLYNQYLQQQFTNYTIELQIATPFANNTFTSVDPFTWNYKYSTPTTLPQVATPILSGGCWQDVYTKAYGTPYPHIEPWVLQGYTEKPTWWDGVYANNNELIFGLRSWKYIHALPVLSSSPGVILVAGNLTEVFNGFDSFTVYYADHISKAVFTVVSTTYVAGNTQITVAQSTTGIITGSQITVGMWDYILRGAIPTGNVPPSSTIPQYAYVSVNISQQTFNDGIFAYGPDNLFPPYWNISAHFTLPIAAVNLSVRSIFDNLAEINSENADYQWNDMGTNQWLWTQTTNYLYSLLTVAYLLEPVRTIQNIFGTKFIYINELPIDSLTNKVFSHTDTQFHGEITIDNQIVSVNGINQWYVNFNRAAGFDASYSDFRSMWTAWTAPLTYLFASFLDTSSLSVQHRIVAIAPSDYAVTMKRSPGVTNYWIDAFQVRVTNVPPVYELYDTQNQWGLELSSQAPVARTISYYAIQLYDFYVDPTTSICSLYTYPIVATSSVQQSFTVAGDISQVFGLPNGASQFKVTGNNAGTYTIKSVVYDLVLNQTVLTTLEPVYSTISTGLLTAINYRTLPWNTGNLVSLATTELLPLPLDATQQYFIIVLSPTTFQLAYNSLDVTTNTPILFTSQAMGIQRIGSLYNTFQALSGAHASPLWSHYNVDTSVVNELTLPANITGIQTLINIIDGYSAYQTAQGFGINVDGSYSDPVTNQQVSWQNEIERFIDWVYQQRSVRRQRTSNKYAVVLNYITGAFTFTSQNPGYLTGTPVVVWSFGGGLPTPLLIGQTYYVINNPDGSVSLASNYNNAIANNAIAIIATAGVGQLYLSDAALFAAELPVYEINPFRNSLWFSPPYGILSNIIVGSLADVYSTQLIFDQYGRRLEPSDIRVFRQDKITQIQFAGGVYNDVMNNFQQNPYQYLHIGGANLYIDAYEHVLRFNDYTTAGALIYDPFLGLNVTKWELDFYRQDEFTERPNVGGYFLSQPYNQGANLDRNLEGSVEDLRYMYDPYKIPETLPAVIRARSILGYEGISNYLSQINLTAKSQFLFWKGAIHNKGSINAITAFVNSRRFINAEVDEFWAYKVAEFGPVENPEYISMLLNITDTQTNDLRLEFILNDQLCIPGYAEESFGNTDCGYANPPSTAIVVDNVDSTFTAVSMTDQSRWYNQPNQLEKLVPDGGVLYFNLKPTKKLTIYTATLNASSGYFNPIFPDNLTDTTSPLFFTNLTDEIGVIVFDPTYDPLTPLVPGLLNPGAASLPIEYQHQYTFWTWNSLTQQFTYSGGWDPGATPATTPVLRHNFMADTITATMDWYPDGLTATYSGPFPTNTKELTLTSPYLPLTNSLTVFENGVQLQVGIDYVESLELYTGSQILGYKLYFINSITGSTIKVVYGSSQLNLDTQFNIVNTNILALLSQEFITNIFTNNTTITLWGLLVDKESQDPACIIDTASNVVLSPVTFWDPARGYHYYEALNAINIITNTDPAVYDSTNGSLNTVWKDRQVGTTWMDATNLTYLPYYDGIVMPVAEDRYSNWGQLAGNGAIHIYEWTKSSVAPSDYNALALTQENDNTIDPSVRVSGTVRQDVRYRNRTHTTAVASPSTQGNTIITIGSSSNTIVSTDLTGLAPSIVTPTDPTYTATFTINGVSGVVYVQGSTASTFSALADTLSSQLTTLDAGITFTATSPNTYTITSNKLGTSSTVAISGDGIFSSITGGATYGSSVPGVNATSGEQTIVLTATPGPNTTTGLVYTPESTSPDNTYSFAVQVNSPGTPSTVSGLGSTLATIGDVINFVNANVSGVTATLSSATTIQIESTVATTGSITSEVIISSDSLFNLIPGFVSVVSTPGSLGNYGKSVVTYTTSYTVSSSTGLAPTTTPANDPAYGFNILIDNKPAQTIVIHGSAAQVYGDLVNALNAQLNSLGASVELVGSSIIITSGSTGTNSVITITDSAYEPLFHTLTLFSAINTSVIGVNGIAGYQIIHVGSHLPTDVTGLAVTTPTSPTYSFTISVDGSLTRTLTYLAAQVATFGDLITLLTTQFALYNASIALSGNTIVITSNTVGTSSAISITADTLFSSITNWVSTVSTPGVNQQITVSNPALFTPSYTVLFSSTGTLPTGLVASQVYTIASIVGNVVTLNGVTITSAGTGVLTMASSVWPSTWSLAAQQTVNLDACIDATETLVDDIPTYTFTQNTTGFAVGQPLNVYVNGVVVQTGYVLTSGGLVFPTVTDSTTVFPQINNWDRITLIVPVPTPTPAQLAFDPTVADDGSMQVQYQYVTNYVATQQFDQTTNSYTYTYYFWVENKTTSPSYRETISEAASDILTPPAPYMFFVGPAAIQGMPQSPSLVANTETGETISEPYRFSQIIVRGLRGYVDDEHRYVLRFTRDFSLRDSLASGTSPLQLKAIHQEWLMFREQQLYNVPVDLWNKITEAMAGYLLSDSSIRIPSLARQLYDAANGTSTQYGLGTNQAFCDGPTAITTIMSYLTDPANNFYPLDLDIFFATYNFDTPANCIAIMNEIYNTFSYIQVNEMFFSVLLDALSVQQNYVGLMKTSAIALYGIELLDVNGAFDD